MLPIELDAAQVALWNGDAQWKQGFLSGLQQALSVQPDVSVVVIKAASDASVLGEYQRTWSSVQS